MMFPLEFKFKYHKKRSVKEEKLAWFKDKLCFWLHWLTIIFATSASFFTGATQTSISAWNMTLHCDDEMFNQTQVQVDRVWPVCTIILISLAVILVLSIKVFLCGPTSEDFFDIMNYLLGLLLSWDVTFVLQSLLSFPIPSFYQNEQLRDYYCCKTCTTRLTKQLLRLDMESRGSFPSFIACGSSYASIFVFLLVCHMDEGQRFVAKLLALFIPGTISFVSCWYLWQCHENHVQDLVGGAIIGSFLAAFIARDMFIKDNMMNKFADNFLSALMSREIQLTQLTPDESVEGERNPMNHYTINLYPQDDNGQQAGFDELPPPYSSLT